ncbi:hypothetical protein A2853_00775 [Candidatus Kaiserbacteria bacterium RIFCSPHIGHO2_01_FULL_55_17]|uniref:MtN3 and saliva related transmembrane protein n=1 Tax=Candidatus Kaiserbacteria bacterium RIFCSPHIGHO2_01_FULL_55_17 TaxID=1798484 RepID=A0A1F6D980_9BACT|nr:MAG: hypothetical protein A2853_00775 [Candidatus Kaiserbacteria bacterium RIFCSPHIGHO2_01_FULL_55_17]
MEWADFFGYAGIFTGVAFMVPQTWKMLRTKSVEDLSWGMLILFFLNCIFWLVYGSLTGAFPVALVNGIALVVSITQIVFKYLYRNNP